MTAPISKGPNPIRIGDTPAAVMAISSLSCCMRDNTIDVAIAALIGRMMSNQNGIAAMVTLTKSMNNAPLLTSNSISRNVWPSHTMPIIAMLVMTNVTKHCRNIYQVSTILLNKP